MAKGSDSPRSMARWVNSLILFVVSGFLAVVGMAFSVEIKGVSDTRQPLLNSFAAICGPHMMGQSFVATAANLNQVDLWLAWLPPQQPIGLAPPDTPVLAPSPDNRKQADANLKYGVFLPIIARAPTKFRYSTVDYVLKAEGCDRTASRDDGEITFSLRQSPMSSEVLATGNIRLGVVEDPATTLRRPYVYRRFTFPPIPDSAGRTFYLSIEAPDSSASAPLLARYHRSDVYAHGMRYVDNIPAEGDLAFRAHYGSVPMGNFQLLLNRLTRSRPAPFNSPWLYPLLLALYAGSVALLVQAIVRELRKTGG
jgi:hypothetical protein